MYDYNPFREKEKNPPLNLSATTIIFSSTTIKKKKNRAHWTPDLLKDLVD